MRFYGPIFALLLTSTSMLAETAYGQQAEIRNENDLDQLLPKKDALIESRKRIDANPKDETGYVNHAQLALALKKPEEAAWALETLLQHHPKRDKIRLDLSLVYVSQQRFEEARILLEAVLSRNPPDVVAENIKGLLARITEAQRKHRFTASVTVGTSSDSNANAGPGSGNISVLDTNVPLGEGAGAQSDLQVFTSVAAGHTYEAGRLGDDLALRWKNNALVYYTEQQDLENLNLQIFSGRTALELLQTTSGRRAEVAAGYNHIILNEQSYLRDPRLEAAVSIPLDASLIFNVAYLMEYRDFLNSKTVTVYSDRAGKAWQMQYGLRYLFSANSVWDSTVTIRREDARQDYYSNHQTAMTIGHYYGFTPDFMNGYLSNWFTTLRLNYKKSEYDRPDFLISSKIREDDEYSVQFMMGRKFEHGITVMGGYTYTDVISNLPNYRYENHRYTISATKSF